MSQATSQQTSNISHRALVSFVTEMIGNGANPNPDDSTPPGPWDPYIRRALNQVILSLGPYRQPWWRWSSGPLPDPWTEVALNPQPLPPKAALALAVAQQVISHVELAQEIANAINREGQQGIIIVGGILSKFVDDCGNDMLWRRWPFPWPRRDADNKLTALELVAMGAQFEQSARATFSEPLQHEFKRAGARLVEMGIARM